jgi:hypothetical protein
MPNLGYIEIINIITDEVETIIKTGDRCLGISYFDGKLYTVVEWQGILVTDMRKQPLEIPSH